MSNHLICHNCGAVMEADETTQGCPRCYADYAEHSQNVLAYFMAYAQQKDDCVVYELDNGEHWVFTPQGNMIASGDYPDDPIIYEEWIE